MGTLGGGSAGASGENSASAARPQSRLRGLARLALLGALALVIVLLPTGAGAVHDLGLFQLDGNATTAGGGAGDDWDRIFDPATFGAASAFSSQFIGADVEAPANDETYFTGGGSKDTNDIPEWTWTPTPTPAAPDKDEILDAYVAAYVNPNPDDGVIKQGDTIVYVGMDRFANNGDANVGFWFMQDPTFGLNSDGSFSGVHTNGDLFVLSGFGNGGSQPLIAVFEWLDGELEPLAAGTPCTGDPIIDRACAEVNTGPIQVPWPYQAKDPVPEGTVPQNSFFEAGIDLNAILPPGEPLPCFASFMGETRSSVSLESQLKDLVIGSIQTCGSIELKKDWVGKDGSTTLNIGTTSGGHQTAQKTVTTDDTTGPQQVPAGTYYVSEDPNPPLGNYTTSLQCVNNRTVPPTPVTPGLGTSVQLAVGDQIVCTYTNTYVKTTPTVSTTLHNAAGDAVVPIGTHLPLGSSLYDEATLANSGGSRSPAR